MGDVLGLDELTSGDTDYIGDCLKLVYSPFELNIELKGLLSFPTDTGKLDKFEFLNLHSNAYSGCDAHNRVYSCCFYKSTSFSK